MKVKFLGTEACPDRITLRDMTFEAGKAVEVEDEGLRAKCLALPYFEAVTVGRPKKTDDQDKA